MKTTAKVALFLLASLLLLLMLAIESAASTCSDSDGGIAVTIPGQVTGLGPHGWPYSREDICIGPTLLKEFYCDGDYFYVYVHQCRSGCGWGQCLPFEPAAIIRPHHTYMPAVSHERKPI